MLDMGIHSERPLRRRAWAVGEDSITRPGIGLQRESGKAVRGGQFRRNQSLGILYSKPLRTPLKWAVQHRGESPYSATYVYRVLFPPSTIERWKVLRRLRFRQWICGFTEAIVASFRYSLQGSVGVGQQIGLRCRGSVGIQHLSPIMLGMYYK